jgi:hypothetical protein
LNRHDSGTKGELPVWLMKFSAIADKATNCSTYAGLSINTKHYFWLRTVEIIQDDGLTVMAYRSIGAMNRSIRNSTPFLSALTLVFEA